MEHSADAVADATTVGVAHTFCKKASLMATIETRRTDDGSTTYRVKVRLRGYPPQHGTFRRLTDAKRWAQATEAAIREGRHFRSSEARRHTVGELVDRYLVEVAPLRPRNLVNTKRHLHWWKSRLGAFALSEITPALVAQCRNELLAQPKRNKLPRASATVLRYLASLSHAFTIAMKDWEWVADNPVQKISKPRQARGRERFLSELERERLLAACRASTSRFLLPVVVLAISTGMRREAWLWATTGHGSFSVPVVPKHCESPRDTARFFTDRINDGTH
jgi:integrase